MSYDFGSLFSTNIFGFLAGVSALGSALTTGLVKHWEVRQDINLRATCIYRKRGLQYTFRILRTITPLLQSLMTIMPSTLGTNDKKTTQMKLCTPAMFKSGLQSFDSSIGAAQQQTLSLRVTL